MPSTYAHYRMGQEVRNLVSANEMKCIEKYTELFNIGLHGPDILFYYRPLSENKVNGTGFGLHERMGKEFFENAAKVVMAENQNAAFMAYLYGFICHFSLDTSCHGYIDEKIKKSGVSHTEIEVEFDRALMKKDGLDPIRHLLTGHIKPTKENAEVIYNFYQDVSKEQVQKSLKGMITYNNLLIAPSKVKRHAVNTMLKISGNYKEMHGLMVNFEPNPMCNDSTEKLLGLYEDAKRLAVQLITEYQMFLDGEMELNQIYKYTFGSKLIGSEVLDEI